MGTEYGRRDFLKLGASAGAGLVLSGINLYGKTTHPKTPPLPITAPPVDPVRVGFVGVGGQGSSHVQNLLYVEGVQIRAVCDIVEEKVSRIQRLVEEAGQPKPAGYSQGKTDFKRMCERDDLDLVYTATPWEWHVPICVEAMKTGKHAAVEVPAAITLDECWELVETSENTKKHCVMMENCCYGRAELTVLYMVRRGLLGEIVHAEGGYLHDLRELKFSSSGEGMWRLEHSARRNANVYPTHGLGPLAECMNINHGDQFDYLVSLKDGDDRAKAIIEAMESIEADYETLRGVLPKAEYQEVDNSVLKQLLQTLNPEELKRASGDIFGRIYEYFLTQFADQKAHDGGEFFTPVSLVSKRFRQERRLRSEQLCVTPPSGSN
jgi:hypothetical protein